MLGAKRYRYIFLEHHSYRLHLLRETVELETGTCFRQTTFKLGIIFYLSFQGGASFNYLCFVCCLCYAVLSVPCSL